VTPRPRSVGALFAELRRRHVVRVAGIYIVTAWALLQAADVLGPDLGFPDGTVGVLFWIALVGLGGTIALTWYYERTPEGLRRDPEDLAEVARQDHGPRRLMVLPFRILRPDAETDFLAFSLPDAITSNLAGLRSLIVRSSVAAARYEPTADLRTLSREAGVDVVLTGTLIRNNGEIEVRAQLCEVSDGTLLWSHTTRAPVGSLFALQEEVTQRVVDSLALPMSSGEQRQLHRDQPASSRAYELYLRANELSFKVNHWPDALALYIECLDEDPRYAPAWAGAGRCHRLLSKYAKDDETSAREAARAEGAFLRALELNPDLPLTHSLYADLEIDTGRAEQAMTRLLGRLASNPDQPEILVGLIQACRYCGVLDASINAFRMVRRLDPQIVTGAAHSYFMAGDYAAALDACTDADIGYVNAVMLTALDRRDEALGLLRAREPMIAPESPIAIYMTSLRALLEGKHQESIDTIRRWAPLQRDAEGAYYTSRQLAHIGAYEDALDGLERSLAGGYFCLPAVLRDPWLDGLRDSPRFASYVERVRTRHQRALVSFGVAGGIKLLGATPKPSLTPTR
jgi:TolB-like protein/tetratricopeptide (TPR) repeat protein